MFSDARRSTPPRFVTRTLIATLLTVAFVLTAVLVIVTFIVRGHVRQAVVAKLETGQRLLATLEERRAEDLRMQVATLAESPTLKAALDTYEAERRTASEDVRTQLTETVARELEKLSARLEADVLAARNFEGEVIAISGRRAQDWAAEYRRADAAMTDATFLTLPSGVFRTMTVPIMLHDVELGSVQFAQALDEHYATGLSALSGARALIVSNDRVLATTLPSSLLAALTPATLETFSAGTLTMLAGEEYAVRPLLQESGAAVYVLDSVDASARPLIRASLQTMTGLAVGAFALAGLASLWLARAVSRPIGTLSRSLTEMTRTRRFDRPLPPSGASLEVDSLTDAFNTMMKSIEAAEAETLNAYLEAIRALALALDARDPYTSGHSERVSTLSVAIGRKMGLDTATLEVLRLGALLHDIGKIGISDNVLRKPSPLTPDEYDIIKTHPTVGSRILRSVRFLEPHLPVVEMHHERPDGQGYPYGLKGSAIPVLARIVHVADAYDAMTSARAYRPALPKATGLRELHRGAGTDFDAQVVRALDAVLAEGEAALRAHGVPAAEAPSLVRGSGGRSRAEVKPDPLEEFSSEGQIA
jgi:putative nucleotidyltransferase with HDIG domain